MAAPPASNPSHLLISRNPRSVAHPQLASTTTTSLYSPQPGPHLFSFDNAGLTTPGSTSGGGGGGASMHTYQSASGAHPPLGSGSGLAGGAPSTHPYGVAHTHGHGSLDPAAANASSYTVGILGASGSTHGHGGGHGLGHMRSHSVPAFPISPADLGEDDDDNDDDDEDDIVVHPTFCRDAALPGRVKVIVGRYEFWCHKEVLWFASPFFNALLQGCWAETSAAAAASPPKPSSPTDTDSREPAPEGEAAVAGDAPSKAQPPPEPSPTAEADKDPSGIKASLKRSTSQLEALNLATDPLSPLPHSPSPRSSRSLRTASRRSSRRSRQSLLLEYDELAASEQKASVYLDAVEEPSAAEILRQLREIPEPTGTALDVIENGRGDADRTPIALAHAPLAPSPPAVGVAQHPLGSPPHVAPSPATPPASTVVPPERPRSAPAQNTTSSTSASPAHSSGPSQHPHPHSLSPPLPLRLQGMTSACPPTVTPASARRSSRDGQGQGYFDPNVAAWPGRTAASLAAAEEREKNIDAVVELHEESPGAFQDFLFWAYPHLECKVTWTNVEGLLALSSKLIVPALQSLCERFLMTHASGRPIIALALAEQHANAELFREASRFVLDQATWDVAEVECLSEQTQLKLSHRRTWFLERLLKLGSIDPKKEYTCRPDCPDPSRCQTQLDEKWRQAHQAVSRYGPPQPSVAFRCLRQLETFPTNPSLVMPHPLCQTAAKSWVMTLFDRMFQPKMAFGAMSPGTEKYWLYITLT